MNPRILGATIARVLRQLKHDHRTVAMVVAVSYTHLRAHETVLDLVCRLLLEKKNNNNPKTAISHQSVRLHIKSTNFNAPHRQSEQKSVD